MKAWLNSYQGFAAMIASVLVAGSIFTVFGPWHRIPPPAAAPALAYMLIVDAIAFAITLWLVWKYAGRRGSPWPALVGLICFFGGILLSVSLDPFLGRWLLLTDPEHLSTNIPFLLPAIIGLAMAGRPERFDKYRRFL